MRLALAVVEHCVLTRQLKGSVDHILQGSQRVTQSVGWSSGLTDLIAAMSSFSIKNILQLERPAERAKDRSSTMPCCWKDSTSRVSPSHETRTMIPCPTACYTCPCCERQPYHSIPLTHSHYRESSYLDVAY